VHPSECGTARDGIQIIQRLPTRLACLQRPAGDGGVVARDLGAKEDSVVIFKELIEFLGDLGDDD